MITKYQVKYFFNNQWKLADAVSLNAAKSIKKWHEFMNGSKTCQIIKIKGEYHDINKKTSSKEVTS